MRAYVLIQTETNDRPIAPELTAIPGVVTASDLRGAFDAIVLAVASSTRDLLDQVISRILAVPGVTRALPAPVAQSLRRRPDSVSDDPVRTGVRAA